MAADKVGLDIDSRYALTGEQVQFFRKHGFVRLRQVLSAGVLAHYGERITQKVIDLNTMHIPMEKRSTYMDMRLAQPVNTSQQHDWDRWCPGARIGEVIDSPLNPLI